MRDRLCEIISRFTIVQRQGEPCVTNEGAYKQLADHLLANGVIVPPCKVGDTVYSIKYGDVIELVVRDFLCDRNGLYSLVVSRKDKYQRCTFEYNRFRGDLNYIKFSREEAEKALERSGK